MEYKCQICINQKPKTNCSHIFHLGINEYSITNIYCDDGSSKLLVKDLNCDCLKKTYYINKYEICSCCLKQNIEYICLECDDSYCINCVKSNEVPNHIRYESIWKESKCLQGTTENKQNHYLIHYNFNRVHNNFYLLFKDIITIVNKIHYLRVFKIKGTEEFAKFKNIFEKSTSSIFEDIEETKEISNFNKFTTLACMAANIEKNTNKLPFALKNSEMVIDVKDYIDEEGMLENKNKFESNIINMIVMTRNKIRILLSNRLKVISANINSDLKTSIESYSSEFTKLLGMFPNSNPDNISFFCQSITQGPQNLNHSNSFTLSNVNQSNLHYHTDLLNYSFDKDKLIKVSSYKLNYQQSIFNSSQNSSNHKENHSSMNISSLAQHFYTFEKRLKNACFIGNYLICNFCYDKFTTIEIFQISSDNKYNSVKIIPYIENAYLVNVYESNGAPLAIVSFCDRVEILSIPKGEGQFFLSTLDQVFKSCISKSDLYLCDKYQIYKLKEEKSCLLNTHAIFVKDEIIDICLYKDYLLVLSNNSTIRIYFKYDIIYLQMIKLSKNVKMIKNLTQEKDEYIILLSVDMKLSLMKFNGLKDLSENIIDIKSQA